MDSKAARIETKNTKINRRADRKLEEVAELMKYSFGNRCCGSEYFYLDKKLKLRGFQHLERLRFNYRAENRLISISYNLIVSSELYCEGAKDEHSFSIKHSGKFSQKFNWVCDNINCEQGKYAHILELLNDDIIVSRIKELQIMRCSITGNTGANSYSIQCELMPGSSTWILIPPILQLIKPKEEECRSLAELFDLLSAVAKEVSQL